MNQNQKLTPEQKAAKNKRKKEAKKRREQEELIREQKRLEYENFLVGHKVVFVDMLNEMFYRVVTDTKYIIHCGKTNSGKTYNALQALKEKPNSIYLAPLRLLAWEVYDKLNSEGYRCDLLTGEEQLVSDNALFASATIEMLDYSKEYGVVVIDESFMINDRDRGKSWTRAMLDVRASEVHIIVNEEALELIKSILKLTNRNFEVKKYEMLKKFNFSSDSTTLSSNLQKGGVFVTFSRMNVLLNKIKLRQLGINAAVLYGNLPPEVKKAQLQGFADGTYDALVTTDVIGIGINLVGCKYIVFLDTEKFDGEEFRSINAMEVRQIAGRAGRYGISEDSFVSADSIYKLNFLKKMYDEPFGVHRGYVGFDYAMFSSFPEDMSIYDRVMAFKEIDFIPKALNCLLFKESIQKYVDVCSIVDRDELSLREKWIFLTAPIKENNKYYFFDCVEGYLRNGSICKPDKVSGSDIQSLEDAISEYELFLNLSRNLNYNNAAMDSIRKEKDALVNKLNVLLLDKKLALKKKCKSCPTMLDITYPYGYCNPCYRKRQDDEYYY